MQTDKSYKQDNFRVQEISRKARQIALDMGIPVIATMQATRAAAKHYNAELDEIAFSDALAQDATAAFRVINERTQPTILLGVAGSREWRMDGLRIHGVPASNFNQIEVVSAKEMMRARSRDVPEDASDMPDRAPTKPATRVSKKDIEEAEEAIIDEQLRRITGDGAKRKPVTSHDKPNGKKRVVREPARRSV